MEFFYHAYTVPRFVVLVVRAAGVMIRRGLKQISIGSFREGCSLFPNKRVVLVDYAAKKTKRYNLRRVIVIEDASHRWLVRS